MDRENGENVAVGDQFISQTDHQSLQDWQFFLRNQKNERLNSHNIFLSSYSSSYSLFFLIYIVYYWITNFLVG